MIDRPRECQSGVKIRPPIMALDWLIWGNDEPAQSALDKVQSAAGSDMLEVTMTAKQEVRSMLEKLPDNCSLEDIQYHLYVLEKVTSGMEDAREHGTPVARRC